VLKQILRITVLATVFSLPAYAQEDTDSGNYIVESCNPNHDASNVEINDKWFICAGAVNTAVFLMAAHHDACVPEKVTLEQEMRVVYKTMEEEPDQLHINYVILIAAALQKAWPCKSMLPKQ